MLSESVLVYILYNNLNNMKYMFKFLGIIKKQKCLRTRTRSVIQLILNFTGLKNKILEYNSLIINTSLKKERNVFTYGTFKDVYNRSTGCYHY